MLRDLGPVYMEKSWLGDSKSLERPGSLFSLFFSCRRAVKLAQLEGGRGEGGRVPRGPGSVRKSARAT